MNIEKAYLNGFKIFCHLSYEKNIVIRKSAGTEIFDGIFTTLGESSAYGNGTYETHFAIKSNKIAGNGDIDLDYTRTINFLKTEYIELSKTQIDRLYELTAEDKNIFDDPENNPLADIGFDNVSEISWECQNIRGKIAADQEFDAIAVHDEFGTSYFIPANSSAIKLIEKKS